MDFEHMRKEVLSARSGRKVASIELIDPPNTIQIGERYSFRVLNGFGSMYRKTIHEEEMTLRVGDSEMLIYITAFPAVREGIGILDVNTELPPRSEEERAEFLASSSSTSLVKRIRGYFKR